VIRYDFLKKEENMIKLASGKLLRFSILLCILLASCATVGEHAPPANYDATVAKWTSYKDVYNWLEMNFVYDFARSGLRIAPMSPAEMFKLKKGACYDSANFAIETLNRINHEYKARSVFIKNSKGGSNHWVTAFMMDGKLFIMDYGTSNGWGFMRGIHGSYKSLSEYERFLSSLPISNFSPAYVEYREFHKEKKY
jgi:hypothetical protein